jgi:hypothetical protein
MSFYAALDAFRNWEGFRLEPAKVAGSAHIFGIGEFISALALLVIVVTVSDFRYRYRFAVQRLNVQTLGIWVAATIGALLLLTECWFQNSLPIPRFINSYGNLKIFLAVAFLVLVFYVVATCFMRPPKFQRSNAKRFSEATVHLVHQGNADRLQVVVPCRCYSSWRNSDQTSFAPPTGARELRSTGPIQFFSRAKKWFWPARGHAYSRLEAFKSCATRSN